MRSGERAPWWAARITARARWPRWAGSGGAIARPGHRQPCGHPTGARTAARARSRRSAAHVGAPGGPGSARRGSMARHYATRDFFRQMPNPLLARYFHARGVFDDLDMAALPEPQPDALWVAWLTLDDPQRHAMDATFQDITALSGLAALVVKVRVLRTGRAPLARCSRAHPRSRCGPTSPRRIRRPTPPARRADGPSEVPVGNPTCCGLRSQFIRGRCTGSAGIRCRTRDGARGTRTQECFKVHMYQ